MLVWTIRFSDPQFPSLVQIYGSRFQPYELIRNRLFGLWTAPICVMYTLKICGVQRCLDIWLRTVWIIFCYNRKYSIKVYCWFFTIRFPFWSVTQPNFWRQKNVVCNETWMMEVQYTRALYSLSNRLRPACKIREQSYIAAITV
jgi:hypothetical protein